MRVALYGGLFGSAMDDYAASAPESVLRRFLSELGHEVIPLPSGRSSEPPDADVHHAHHFGEAAFRLALSGIGPFVFTAHNPFLLAPVEPTESRVDRVLQAAVLGAADAVVALSEREANVLSARFEVPRERFTVIPNGLDLDRYAPGDESLEGGSLRLLTVGQLLPYKGHRLLLLALARLPRASLTLVSHESALRDEYERLSAELGIGDRVAFEGPLATDELVERYRRCDVYVQPSLAEAFPVTVAEAMACSRPVVVSDVGGCAEEVGDGGVIVPPGDVDALVAALENLAADPERRRRLGTFALARARALYDGREVARRHAELYAKLAGRRRTPTRAARLRARAILAAYRRRGGVARAVPSKLKRRRVAG